MSRWPADATRPTEDEVQRMIEGDPSLSASMREATRPTDAEVTSLQRRLAASRTSVPAAAWRRPALALAFATAAVLWWVALRDPSPAVPLPAPVEVTRFAYSAAGSGSHQAERDAEGLRVVHDGELTYTVAPLPPGERFRVVAGVVEVVVVGTVFRVTEHDVDDVEVVVTEGRVEVRSRSGSVLLEAGESWRSPGVPAPVPVPGPALSPVAVPRPAPLLPTEDPPPSRAEVYASLLVRAEAGERSAMLAEALEAFADADADALSRAARVLAVKVGADERPPSVTLQRANALLADPAEFPGRADVALVVAEIHRAAGDCGAAIPYYRTATSPVRRADALAGWGLCEDALGRRAEADRLLDEAVYAGLAGRRLQEVRLHRAER